jgi:hypothetical protein
MRDAYPAVISTQFTGNTSLEAAGSLRTGIPQVAGPDLSQGVVTLPLAVGTSTFPQVFNRGYIQSLNATVQRDVGLGFNVQAAYVASRAIRQTANVNINSSGPGGGNTGRALYPRIGAVNELLPFNTSTYHSLQTQTTRRMGADSLFGISYTYSKALGYADNSDSGLTFNSPQYWARNRALAGYDRTHNLQIYAVYALPFGRGKQWAQSGLASKLAGGWQVNSLMSRTSGTPFTVGSAATSLNSQGNSQTADQVLSDVKILGGHGRNESYFDPNAFAPVTAVRFGNTGKNILRGPGLFNLDLSLFRNFAVTERFKLQFRAEAFGVTNTPVFANPAATVSSATRNTDGSIRALNGYTEITSASGERQFRFALKLFF